MSDIQGLIKDRILCLPEGDFVFVGRDRVLSLNLRYVICSNSSGRIGFKTNLNPLLNTYSMKQPDLYYFETMKMTSHAYSNFLWRIRAAGECSL